VCRLVLLKKPDDDDDQMFCFSCICELVSLVAATCEIIHTVCLSVFSVCHLSVCTVHLDDKKTREYSAEDHITLAKGPDKSLAQGPNKKLLL